MSNLLNYQELADEVARILISNNVTPPNKQSAALPDVRTLRYYLTQGLLDKAATVDGKQGFGYKHLLQILATRRLQAEGFQLKAIKSRIQGAALDDLLSICKIPKETLPDLFVEEASKVKVSAESFHPEKDEAPSKKRSVATLTQISLTKKATLLLNYDNLSAEDLTRIESAAAPLLDVISNLKGKK